MINGISVVIPTMNRPDSLARTIRYMSECDVKPDQIVIVDQSQSEQHQSENRKVIEDYKRTFQKIDYIYQDIPRLTKVRNIGVYYAENEVIVFSDDDVDVRKNTFSCLASLFENKYTAMVGGVNEGEEEVHSSLSSFIFGMASYLKRDIGHVSRACYGRFPEYTSECTPTEWVMGFFFAVRKSLMDKWNARFDENLRSYAYAEDLDFSYGYYLHAENEDLSCFMSRSITVKHNVSKEYRIPKRNHIFMSVLHRYYISKKYNMPIYELHNLWCNFGIFIFKILKRERPVDMFDAQLFYYRHRTEILKGNFLNELWTK